MIKILHNPIKEAELMHTDEFNEYRCEQRLRRLFNIPYALFKIFAGIVLLGIVDKFDLIERSLIYINDLGGNILGRVL